MAKYTEIGMKFTFAFQKYVNQPVMNAKIIYLKKTKKNHGEKADCSIWKVMEHKKITREKEKLKIWSPQYEREF